MGDNCFKWNQGTGLKLSCQLAYQVRHFTANSNATWTDFHITWICIQLFSKQVLLMICPLLNQFRKKCSLYSGCHWHKLFPKVWFWQYYDCKSVASVCRLTKAFFKNTNSYLQFSGVVFPNHSRMILEIHDISTFQGKWASHLMEAKYQYPL